MPSFLSLWVLVILFTGCCGYDWGTGALATCYHTISVPYVAGDTTGSLTAAVIREIGIASPFRVVNCGGDLTLQITVCNVEQEDIGFRYNENSQGNLTNETIPAETRICMTTQVQIIDNSDGSLVLGPVKIAAAVDFDHEYTQSRDGINVYSLGQVTDMRDATETAYRPLTRQMAQKIVDYITNAW